jgi:formylglycine-generating enzyme required for sulfatase activity
MRKDAPRGPAIIIETAPVPAGRFRMGSDDGRPDERPAHTVHVGDFRMALVPVTNELYRDFLGATRHNAPRFWNDGRFNAKDQPVVGVSWFDASAFCAWLSQNSGYGWRLPTEAEREKAALGGENGVPTWAAPTSQDAPFGVGLSAPNGYGLFDLDYNVHEWCSDWYGHDYYAASPATDPLGPRSGTRRASRGGAWRHQIKTSRPSARSSLDPTFQYNDYGFRLALNADGDGLLGATGFEPARS